MGTGQPTFRRHDAYAKRGRECYVLRADTEESFRSTSGRIASEHAALRMSGTGQQRRASLRARRARIPRRALLPSLRRLQQPHGTLGVGLPPDASAVPPGLL